MQTDNDPRIEEELAKALGLIAQLRKEFKRLMAFTFIMCGVVLYVMWFFLNFLMKLHTVVFEATK